MAKEIINIMAMLAGIISTFGYFTQAYKIVKNKSAKNISIYTYFLFLYSLVVWLVYGIIYASIPIITPNIVGIIGCVMLIISFYVYRNSDHYHTNYGKLSGSSDEYHALKLKQPHLHTSVK